MSHCVLMHRSDSIYDDSPAERYQFPKQYYDRITPGIGDWILYLEPSKVRNSRGYFAIARIQDIIPDSRIAGMFIATIEPGSYLDFPNPVPFNDFDGPIERGLLNESGKLSGRAQAAVRPISNVDFQRILECGLSDAAPLLPRTDSSGVILDAAEEHTPFILEQTRDRAQSLASRLLRDRAFRKIVLKAYDERCAITGLKLINGGGRAEVNAAHIRPVENDGPDSVQNGIALSGTVHWMFDRGLLSLKDDYSILLSRKLNHDVSHLLNKDMKATVPSDPRLKPHPAFLQWHRKRHDFHI
ncbi:MAG: HNH endonuclease [Oricola sp.]